MQALITYVFFTGLLFGVISSYDADEDDDCTDLCTNKDDIKECLRDFFSQKLNCSALRNDKNEPITQRKMNEFGIMPRINSTLYVLEANYTNLDGNVERFCLHSKTGEIVMSVHMKMASIDTNSILSIQRRGDVPKNFNVRSSGIQNLVSTALIPKNLEDIKNKLKVFAYFPEDFSIKFSLTPESEDSLKDPHFAAAGEVVNADKPAIIQELYVTGACYFFRAYIDKYIADCPFSQEMCNVIPVN